MRNRNADKYTLDQAGRQLLAAARLSDAEIDGITASPQLYPQLYRKVKARMRAGETRPERSIPWFHWAKHASAYGAVIFMVLAAAGYFYLSGIAPVPANEVAERQVPVLPPEAARHSVPPEPPVEIRSTSRAAEINVRPERASARQIRTVQEARPQRAAYREPDAEFYSLTFAGDPYETARGGRVIRMDVSRSALFAMGVDIPLENGPESVKADVLVGPDGIARAIRIIE
jgi:hypothetical protein